MKNYFSSISLPRDNLTPKDLAKAISELVDQLAITVNSLDLENLSPRAQSSLSTIKLHVLTRDKLGSHIPNIKKGDMVAVTDQDGRGLLEVTGLYVYK